MSNPIRLAQNEGIEERRWYISKIMITLSTVHNPKRIP